MPALKSLTFTALPRTRNDPVSFRRSRFAAKLEDQKQLLADPAYARTTQRWVTVNGEKQLVSRQQRVRPWWRTDANGQLVMSIWFGSKPLEFEKGKAGVAVSGKDQLPSVIDTLIAAVRAGELDDLLSQASKQRGPVRPKK